MLNSRYQSKRFVLSLLAIGLMAVVTALFVYSRSAPGTAATAPAAAAPSQRVTIVNGETTITLAPAIQLQSGLHAEPLPALNHRAETTAYGTVLDLQPLLDLRNRFMTARAEADAAVAAAASSRHEFERNRLLYQDNQNVSLKAYQAAQAIYLADQARKEAAQRTSENIRGEALQKFGEPLGQWVLGRHSSHFEKLLNRQEVLLRVSLPAGAPVKAPAMIQIAANNAERLPAYLVSPSPQNDPAIQGTAFLYRTAVPIAAGTNIVAYLPASGAPTQGVLVPARALVWYGGQPWAYVQIAPDRFARRPVVQQAPMDGGFFVDSGIRAGERVVVSGAELLLSEELRPPPNSSGCKDPECD